MRYVIASMVATLLSAALFVFHWWVGLALQKESEQLPEGVAVKLPQRLEELLSWHDFLYGGRYVFIPVFFIVCLGVAWHTRHRLQVR